MDAVIPCRFTILFGTVGHAADTFRGAEGDNSAGLYHRLARAGKTETGIGLTQSLPFIGTHDNVAAGPHEADVIGVDILRPQFQIENINACRDLRSLGGPDADIFYIAARRNGHRHHIAGMQRQIRCSIAQLSMNAVPAVRIRLVHEELRRLRLARCFVKGGADDIMAGLQTELACRGRGKFQFTGHCENDIIPCLDGQAGRQGVHRVRIYGIGLIVIVNCIARRAVHGDITLHCLQADGAVLGVAHEDS